MAAAAIFNFQKFEILTVDPLQGANMRHLAKFHQNRSNGCRDSDLTVIKMVAVCHLEFLKFEIFNGRRG